MWEANEEVALAILASNNQCCRSGHMIRDGFR